MTVPGHSLHSLPEADLSPNSSTAKAKATREKTNLTPPEKSTVEEVRDRTKTSAVTFKVNTNTGQVFIHVVDRDTGKLIREIPSEESQKLATALEELSGKLFSTSV